MYKKPATLLDLYKLGVLRDPDAALDTFLEFWTDTQTPSAKNIGIDASDYKLWVSGNATLKQLFDRLTNGGIIW